jgi:hypothetical protein
MGKGEYHDVFAVNKVVIEHVRETSKKNAPKPIAEFRPAIGRSYDSTHCAVNFRSEFEPEPMTATFVPHARLSEFLRSQPMKTNVEYRHVGSLLLFAQTCPGYSRRGIVVGFL